MKNFSVDTRLPAGLPWPRESERQLCPARTHDAPVRVLSCSGSHLFGSDEGRGISFLRCPRLNHPPPLTLRCGVCTRLVRNNNKQASSKNACHPAEHKRMCGGRLSSRHRVECAPSVWFRCGKGLFRHCDGRFSIESRSQEQLAISNGCSLLSAQALKLIEFHSQQRDTMIQEEQNRAIAMACGKIYHKPTEAEIASGSYYQYEPDYVSDLNLMHRAEETLPENLRFEYHNHIFDLVPADENHGPCDGENGEDIMIPTGFSMLHASAAQRAEAFLKTQGLWEEQPQPDNRTT